MHISVLIRILVEMIFGAKNNKAYWSLMLNTHVRLSEALPHSSSLQDPGLPSIQHGRCAGGLARKGNVLNCPSLGNWLPKSYQDHCVALLLISHWPKQVSWPCLISNGSHNCHPTMKPWSMKQEGWDPGCVGSSRSQQPQWLFTIYHSIQNINPHLQKLLGSES